MEDKSKNTLQAIQFSGIRGSETIRAVTLPGGGPGAADRGGPRPGERTKAAGRYRERSGVLRPGGSHDLQDRLRRRRWPALRLIPVKQQRAEGLYEADRTALIKRSERNPIVTKLLEGALKGRTHQLLHVEYKRPDKA